MRHALPLLAALAIVACDGGPAPKAEAAQPAALPPPPEGPRLAFPLACRIGVDCEVQRYVDRDPGPGLLDYRCGRRTGEAHDGVDIRLVDMALQARGVDVLAAAAGRVVATRDGVEDVSVAKVGRAAVDAVECGNRVAINHGDGWISDYCHMAKGSIRVKTGDVVAAGQPIGRVGLSGLTEFPHVHMSVRHNNVVVDPFAPGPVSPGACPAQAPLWTPQAAVAMTYKAGVILNAGFAGEPVTMEAIEAGRVAPFTAASPVVATYLRALQLDRGDELELVLTGPGGARLAEYRSPPLDNDKAQQFNFIGKRRPPAGWPPGEYRAELRVHRGRKVVLQKTLSTRI
ncbi:M23 family metallopeptidase [Phenylobacterium sp.]|jgi:hypothetical protein|uniref:M23 family metallopeptidase n=1 Tax=Phenylobacterium sp. TaxID=1871053 RepID=UPI002F936B1F